MRRSSLLGGCAALFLAAGGSLSPALADAVADFYRGKTVRVIVGYSVGGGYDLYARAFAEFMPKHMPGNPVMVVQNMPGAGSFVAAKNLYSVAPKDGTALGSVSQTLPLDAAIGEDPAQFDVTKMPYVGRLLDNVDVGVARPGVAFKSFEDLRTQQAVVGATGPGSPGLLVPLALVQYAGANFKIVAGYGGSAEIDLAAERGEVDMFGAVGFTFVMQRHPDWLKEKKAPFIYQSALKRHPLLPETPTLPELGLTDEGKGVLHAIAASSEIGRAILTTPGVPPERLAALRKAFQSMVEDPAFLDAMAKREVPIFAARGEELDAVTRDLVATPKRTLDLTKALLEAKR